MKKYVGVALFLAVLSLWIIPEPIARPLFHLIVLGIIPGTSVEMGLIFPLVLTVITSIFVIRFINEASQALLEYKTKIALAEREAKEQTAMVQTGQSADKLMDEEIDIISI